MIFILEIHEGCDIDLVLGELRNYEIIGDIALLIARFGTIALCLHLFTRGISDSLAIAPSV